MKDTIKTQTKGVSLVWVVILITIVMIIITSLTSATVKELRMTTGADLSVQAYAAARAGIEANSVSSTCNGLTAGTRQYTLDAATNTAYEVTVNPGASYCDIDSVGRVGLVTRKIHQRVSAQPAPTNVIQFPDDIQNAATVTLAPVPANPVTSLTDQHGYIEDGNSPGGNFTQQFDVNLGATDSFAPIGTGNGTFLYMVGLESRDGDANNFGQLKIYRPTSPATAGAYTPSVISLPTAISNSISTLRIVITYNGSKFSVKVKDATGLCLASYNDPTTISGYHFDKIYVEDIDNAASVSAPNFGYLQNMVFTGVQYNPRVLTYSLGVGGASILPIANATQSVPRGGNGAPVSAVAKDGYYFHGWDDGNPSNPRQDLNVQNDINAVAIFWPYISFGDTAGAYGSSAYLAQGFFTSQLGSATVVNQLETGASPTPGGIGLHLQGAYAGPLRVDWPQDPNDSYITKKIDIPFDATRLTFDANAAVGTAANPYNDVVIVQLRSSDFSALLPGADWQGRDDGVGSTGTGLLIAGQSFSGPVYGGWNPYSYTIPDSYKGQTIIFYARAHNGGFGAHLMLDNIRVQ